jgi:hypothetical protein
VEREADSKWNYLIFNSSEETPKSFFSSSLIYGIEFILSFELD